MPCRLDPSTLRADALVCEAVMRAGDTPCWPRLDCAAAAFTMDNT